MDLLILELDYFLDTMNLLKISSLSDLGICQVEFLNKMLGRVERTPYMKTGEKHHEKLTEGMKKISDEDIIRLVKNGVKVNVREVFVKSDKAKLIGRIDQINFLGFKKGLLRFKQTKNLAIVSDDKFTRKNHFEIPNYYKLPLAGYSVALESDTRFENLVDVVGVKLSFHDMDTRKHMNTFEANSDILDNWEDKIPKVVNEGLKILDKEKAEHKLFNIETGKWEDCWKHKSYFK